MATTTGPDFVSFQVRNLDLSCAFYEGLLGLNRLPGSNPGAVVFSAGGTAFAVRDPFPGVDLDAGPLGTGIGVWFHNQIVQEPFEGPFGLQFSVRDPDGYVVTVHSKA
jgi:predicted enzyme related to lactoylglutathione lyase